jgi:hypothetical protein
MRFARSTSPTPKRPHQCAGLAASDTTVIVFDKVVHSRSPRSLFLELGAPKTNHLACPVGTIRIAVQRRLRGRIGSVLWSDRGSRYGNRECPVRGGLVDLWMTAKGTIRPTNSTRPSAENNTSRSSKAASSVRRPPPRPPRARRRGSRQLISNSFIHDELRYCRLRFAISATVFLLMSRSQAIQG